MLKIKHPLKISLFIFLFFSWTKPSSAQQQFEKAVDYLEYMGNHKTEISKDFMTYTSAIAHSRSTRKVENRRKELIQTIVDARKQIASMPAFKGDKALRDSTVTYLQMTYHVLNDDYGKVVNLEEVAEQSYDAMEAYFKAQDLANEQLGKANFFIQNQLKSFAERNNIQLIDSKDELGKKLEISDKINTYHRELFLIKFRCSNQERYLIEAMNKKDINAMEQNKNSLEKYSEENLKKLITIKAYQNDNSLVNSCKQLLLFYQNEAKVQMPILLDFFVKQDNFNKLKKAFELKKEEERTQADVDAYNKAVDEINAASKKFNTSNNQLNEKRKTLNESWDTASRKFLDTHIPKY